MKWLFVIINLSMFIPDSFSQENPIQNSIPSISQIINPSIDTALLFDIWVLNPESPHADFWWTKDSYYVVDYDGNGKIPFRLEGDEFELYFEEETLKGKL